MHRVKAISKQYVLDMYDQKKEKIIQVSPICRRLREVREVQREVELGATLEEIAKAKGVTHNHLKKFGASLGKCC